MATRRGPDNSVRVAISGTVNSENYANIFWCQLATSSSIIQADLDAWLNTFRDFYATDLLPQVSNAVAQNLASAVLFTPGGGALHSVHSESAGGSHSGTGIDDNSAAIVLSWAINAYWRGGKPRTYLPNPTTGQVDDGNAVNGSAITAAAAAAEDFRGDVNGITQGTITGTQLGVVSFRSGNVDRTPPLFYAYTGVLVHTRLGTQRRRLGRWMP